MLPPFMTMEFERTVDPPKAGQYEIPTALLGLGDNDHQHHDEPSPAEKVFSTVELLEMILLELPITTVFVVQGVNNTFRDTIIGSIRLRRTMFLATDPSFEANDKQRINPILEMAAFQPKPGLFLEHITEMSCPLYRRLRFMVDYDLPYFTTSTSKPSRARDKIWFGHVRKSMKPLKLPHRKDVRESWQYMLVKQGRAAKTSVRLWYHNGQATGPLDYAKEKFKKRTFLGRIWDFVENMH